jgi:hypothetical protein
LLAATIARVIDPIAIARAFNWTGNKARTQVARTLARDTGVGYGVIRKHCARRRAILLTRSFSSSIPERPAPLA